MARRANFETVLSANDKAFNKTMAKAEKRGKKFSAAMTKSINGIGVLAASAGAAVAASFQKFDRIAKLASAFDISGESLQRLEVAADETGASLESLAKAMFNLNKNVWDPGEFESDFRALNLNFMELRKLDPEQQILAFSDAMKAANGSTRSLAAAQNILGRSGKDLVNFLKLGSDGAEELGAKLGVIVSDETLKSIESFNDQMELLKTNLTATLANAANPFVEKLNEMGLGLKTLALLIRNEFSESGISAAEFLDAQGEIMAEGRGSRELTKPFDKKKEEVAKEEEKKQSKIVNHAQTVARWGRKFSDRIDDAFKTTGMLFDKAKDAGAEALDMIANLERPLDLRDNNNIPAFLGGSAANTFGAAPAAPKFPGLDRLAKLQADMLTEQKRNNQLLEDTL